MKKIKSILAILAAVMSVSFAYAQENTAEAVPAQQAGASVDTQTSTVDTDFGTARVTKAVSANSTNLQVALDSVPAGADARDIISTVHAIAARAADAVHVPFIHAMAAATNTRTFSAPEGSSVVLNATLPNSATERANMVLNVGGNTVRFSPTATATDAATNVSGDLSVTDANGATSISNVQVSVPRDGSNVSGRVGDAAIEVPPANFIARPDTARPNSPTAEETQVDNPDLSIRIGRGELTPEN